ncbi:MAG: hypothetical protein OHK0017_05610 [Patescibacteria group bacterium]
MEKLPENTPNDKRFTAKLVEFSYDEIIQSNQKVIEQISNLIVTRLEIRQEYKYLTSDRSLCDEESDWNLFPANQLAHLETALTSLSSELECSIQFARSRSQDQVVYACDFNEVFSAWENCHYFQNPTPNQSQAEAMIKSFLRTYFIIAVISKTFELIGSYGKPYFYIPYKAEVLQSVINLTASASRNNNAEININTASREVELVVHNLAGTEFELTHSAYFHLAHALAYSKLDSQIDITKIIQFYLEFENGDLVK